MGEHGASSRSTEGWRVPGHGYGRQEAPEGLSPWRLGLPGERRAPGIALLTSGTWGAEEPPPDLPPLPFPGLCYQSLDFGAALSHLPLTLLFFISSHSFYFFKFNFPLFFLFPRSAKPNSGMRQCQLTPHLLMLTLHRESLPDPNYSSQ